MKNFEELEPNAWLLRQNILSPGTQCEESWAILGDFQCAFLRYQYSIEPKSYREYPIKGHLFHHLNHINNMIKHRMEFSNIGEIKISYRQLVHYTHILKFSTIDELVD